MSAAGGLDPGSRAMSSREISDYALSVDVTVIAAG